MIKLASITEDAVAPYATLLRGAGGLVEAPSVVEHDGVEGRHALSILSRQASPLENLSLTWLERHPHSAQTFIPIKSGRWLVVLVPDDAEGKPDMARAKGFLAGPEDAIVIHRNVWHAGMTVFDKDADFAMIMWKASAGDDGEVFNLSAPVLMTP